jgi:hypothetical protein
VMARVGLAACAGGRARRRCVLRPACSSVFVRRRWDEVRRHQSGTSGEVVFGPRAWGASLSIGRLVKGLVGVEEGGSGRSTVVGARVSPVNLRSGEAESERGCTVKAEVGFIGVGTGVGAGSGIARRVACGAERRGVLWHCQGASNTWSFLSARVLALAEQLNVRFSP